MSDKVKLKETQHFSIYEPPDLKGTPGLALCFSPGGDARTALAQVYPFASRYRLVVAGSKVYQNGQVDIPAMLRQVQAELIDVYHPDPTRSFCTGLSGGGQFSYMVVTSRPQWFAGVLVNTCRINPDYRKASDFNRPKWAMMLASPSDFRYAEMKQDKTFLEQCGWRTYWLEFKAGHTYAPRSTFEAALATLGKEGLTTP